MKWLYVAHFWLNHEVFAGRATWLHHQMYIIDLARSHNFLKRSNMWSDQFYFDHDIAYVLINIMIVNYGRLTRSINLVWVSALDPIVGSFIRFQSVWPTTKPIARNFSCSLLSSKSAQRTCFNYNTIKSQIGRV